MRKSYLLKLLVYMKKVFKIGDKLSRLMDSRLNPTYRTSEAILPVLLGFSACYLKKNTITPD